MVEKNILVSKGIFKSRFLKTCTRKEFALNRQNISINSDTPIFSWPM